MDRRSPRDAPGDRVYHAIKARIITYAFPQGQRIYLQPLADSLGVSTTPVREALNRLAAEDLVIKAPQKGFIAMRLSADNLLGYYELTRFLVTRELEGLDAAGRERLSEYAPIGDVLYRLSRSEFSDPNGIAGHTGEVFLCMGSVGGNVQVARSIGHANDQLHFIRTAEARQFENARDDLMRLCELLLAGRCMDLLLAIHKYHDERVRILPTLVELASRLIRRT